MQALCGFEFYYTVYFHGEVESHIMVNTIIRMRSVLKIKRMLKNLLL